MALVVDGHRCDLHRHADDVHRTVDDVRYELLLLVRFQIQIELYFAFPGIVKTVD